MRFGHSVYAPAGEIKNQIKLNKLKILRDKLKILEEYKKNNRIDFLELSKYKKQEHVIKRVVESVLKLDKKQSKYKFITIFGGNQSGKSEAGAIAVAMVFDLMPGCKILSATVETKLSINVQQKKYYQYLRKRSIEYGDYNLIRGWKNNVVVGKNSQQIIFKTYAQGAQAFQGDEYDLIHLDEECPWDVFQECVMRTVKRDGVILMTFTSLLGFTRLVNFLWESGNPAISLHLLDLYDNPYILKESKDIVAANIDPDEIESRIHGKPHLKEGLIYKEFSDIHKIEPFDVAELCFNQPTRWQIHEAIDPHERTPHHWLRFLFDRDKNIIYVIDELKAPTESMLVSDFSKLIKARGLIFKNVLIQPEFIQIDTSSMKPDVINKVGDEYQEDVNSIRLEFFKNGINTILVSKNNAVGINAVKERLKVLKTPEGEIKRAPSLYIFKDCVGTIWEFMRYSWESYQSGGMSERKELMNNPRKKDDHFMDLIKYECIKMLNDYGGDNNFVKGYDPRYPDIGY